MIVFDTNVWSEPLARDPDAGVLEWFLMNQREATMTTVTLGELLYGAHRLPHGKRRNALIASIEIALVDVGPRLLEVDEAASRQYAELRSDAEKRGFNGQTEDFLIAGICRANKVPLATRNTKDFQDMEIELINPWEATK